MNAKPNAKPNEATAKIIHLDDHRKKGEKPGTVLPPSADFDRRLEKVRASIERINKLMTELKGKP